MKKYRYFMWMILLSGVLFLNVPRVSAREFDAVFFGCSNIDCNHAGYYGNGKWQNIKYAGTVSIHFEADYTKYKDYKLPDCKNDGFIGWNAVVANDSVPNDTWLIFCDDDGKTSDSDITSKDAIDFKSKCNNQHIFKNKFLINSDKYYEVQFYAVYEDGYQDEYGINGSACYKSNSGNSGGNSSGGSSSYDFSDKNKVECGNIGKFHKKIPELTSWIITIVQVAVPVLLIILGMIDFIKSLVSQKEDEIKQGQKIFIKRIITGVLIFFVVVIVKLVVSLVATSTDSKNFISCIDCFISNKCN